MRLHLETEQARLDAAHPAQGRESVAVVGRPAERGVPRRADAELGRRELERLPSGQERHLPVCERVRPLLEARPRRVDGQPADVEAGDLRAGGEV